MLSPSRHLPNIMDSGILDSSVMVPWRRTAQSHTTHRRANSADIAEMLDLFASVDIQARSYLLLAAWSCNEKALLLSTS